MARIIFKGDVKTRLHNIKRYNTHKEMWDNCRQCTLCENRRNVIYYRGHIPCDLLIIGEAPGETEDLFGYPMVGPTKEIIDQLMQDLQLKYTYGITNIVACHPQDNRTPHKREVEQCFSRLASMVALVNPHQIILMGKTAQKYGDSIGSKTKHIITQHPAVVVRLRYSGMDTAADVSYKRILLTIKKGLYDAKEEVSPQD